MIGFKYTVWCAKCVENGWDVHHGGKIRKSAATYSSREEAEHAALEVVGHVQDWKFEVFEVEVAGPTPAPTEEPPSAPV